MKIREMINQLIGKSDLRDFSDEQLKYAANKAVNELGRRGWKCYDAGAKRREVRFSKSVEL